MPAIGKIPENILLLNALDVIGETIIIADSSYTIRWMNTEACRLMGEVAPLYGMPDCEAMIGMNMDDFHERPEHQNKIMQKLTGVHRTRITIRNQVMTDIVITPIMGSSDEPEGYIVMLMDVTMQAEEQKRSAQLIKELSIPILNIWDKTIALPLIGDFDKNRTDQLIATVLMECSEKQIEYVLIDLSGIKEFENQVRYQIQMMTDTLNLIGATCILVGISPKLAMSIVQLDSKTPIFSTAHEGLKHIIQLQAK
ncbi:MULTISPECIES: STAS domain-containing protein [Caryophanaceae]|uniref:Anti-anti-sigma regulatory factor n=1 Tax=Planomicrobium stackebrandtii TaxID=253160 RepID=A0ABU0GYR6_9BACL|nr:MULTISPECIES: STAS domain-containing protein [Planococcaceae]MDQ0429712.1 anti-anti-sigma regulatory factor [Planomicrobium stackebrandtii]